MRTTVRLDDDLLRKAKEHAARTGRSLTSVIEDALRQSLSRPENDPRELSVELPTFGSGGLLPGVDLDDTASLLDLMDQHRDTD